MIERSRVLLLMMLVWALPIARGDLPTARLHGVAPMGGQQGQSVDVTVRGENLDELTQLMFSDGRLTAERKENNVFTVHVPADQPLGPYDVRAVGKWGVSNPRTFVVGSLPEAMEAEPNNVQEQSQVLTVPVTVNGVIAEQSDVDYYSVPLAEGQSVTIECHAERIDSTLDGVLTVFGPDGRALELSNNDVGKDPRIDFTAPAAGDYRIRIHDLIYAGSPNAFYRLSIHSNPVVVAVEPPALPVGEAGEVRLLGRHIADGEPMPDAVVDGEPLLASPPMPLSPPGADQSAKLELVTYLTPVQAAEDAFAARSSAGQPVLVGIANYPLSHETEPNDEDASATRIELPTEIVGRFQQKGDRDCYRFHATKGQVLEVQTFAERAGSPADVVMLMKRVTAEAGENTPLQSAVLAEWDDDARNVGGLAYITSSHDPYVVWTAPEDGDYLLEVKDRFGESRGDARFFYRVRLAPPKPDFRLLFAPGDLSNPSTLLARAGGTSEATVYLIRQGGFSGEVRVQVEGLPDSVTTNPVTIGPGANAAPVVFTAKDDAAEFTGLLDVTATATIGEETISRRARAATIIWPAAGNAPRSARLTRDIPIAVRSKAISRLEAVPDRTVAAQGSLLPITAKLTRISADNKEPHTGITALWLPVGIENAAGDIGEGQAEVFLPLFVKPDAAVGTYTTAIKGTATVAYQVGEESKKLPVTDASPTVQITVIPRPAEVIPSTGEPALRPGSSSNLAVKIQRHNGYTGAVRLHLNLPPGLAGLSSTEVVVPADITETVLPIHAAGNLPAGDKAGVTIRAVTSVDGQAVPVDARIVVKVNP